MYTIEGPEDGGKAPKGPNFLLIVALAGVAIFVVLGLAMLFVPDAMHRLRLVHPDPHPTSQVRGAGDSWAA
jgi:hypothetical protein